MTGIDAAIAQVENLYRTITGHDVVADGNGGAPIPPERDPAQFVEEQMERLAATLSQLQPQAGARAAVSAGWIPALCAWDQGNEVRLALDLPGVSREHLKLAFADGCLVVSGRREAPWAGAEEPVRVHAAESLAGPFQRVIPLPPGLCLDQVDAWLNNSVLGVRIPRGSTTQEMAQSITVR